jgi:hypothetical protein
MEIETLGVARSLGWKVHMRYANGYRDSTTSMRRCVYRQQLDLDAGCDARAKLPAITARVALMCPPCGKCRVTVVFEPPSNAQVGQG